MITGFQVYSWQMPIREGLPIRLRMLGHAYHGATKRKRQLAERYAERMQKKSPQHDIQVSEVMR